jgi:hypothetical protein
MPMQLSSLSVLRSPRLRLAVAILVLAGCNPYEVARAAATAHRVSAGKPLPADQSTALADQDAALLNAWFERNVIQAYRKVGHRNPKWDGPAEAFLRENAPGFLGLAPAATLDLRARAKVVLDAGCDDPAVLFFAAWAAAGENEQSREASELFERAVAGMHDTAYPRALARFAASGLRQDYDRRDEGTGKRAALDPVELRWFKESLTDGSYGPDEDVVFATHFVSGSGSRLLDRNLAAVTSAVEATPWVDPWVRLLLKGKRQIEEAWNSRGVRYASKVKEEEWKGMRESLTLAREALTASWKLRPDRPEAAAAMISVAMADAEPGESPRLWFDRAVAARFDYMPAYFRLRSALRWRWSGDPDALLAFARECAATRRFDTEVPLEAFHYVEQIERDRFQEARYPGDIEDPDEARAAAEAAVLPPSPYKSEDVYELVSTVLMRYRRQTGDVRWQRYASFQAEVDYKAERYEAARKVLDELTGRLEPEARERVGGTLPEARIYALASPLGTDVKRAEDMYKAGKVAEAVALLGKARASAPAQALPYFDQRLAAGRIEADLDTGAPATPFSTRTLAGWTPVNGTWKVESDGSLVATSDARGHLISGDARVGGNVEITADIEIESTSNGQFQAGIALGRVISISDRDWLCFRVKNTAHEGKVVYFSQNLFAPRHMIPYPVGLKSHVVVQSFDGHLWAYVDGKAVVTDYIPEWKMTHTGDVHVGFGAYVNDNTTVVRYRNVRVQRLTKPPTPPAAAATTAASAPANR